jgi:hypothetical protein
VHQQKCIPAYRISQSLLRNRISLPVRLADKQFKIVVQFFFTLPKAEYLRNIKGKIHTGLLIVGHGVPGPGQSKKNLISGSSYTKKLRDRC